MPDYETVEFNRRGDVLELRFHTDGGPLIWSATAHREIGDAFHEIGQDPTVKVVVLTGTGSEFCTQIDGASFAGTQAWDRVWWEGKRLLSGLLNLDVPVIGVVNGPAFIHAELPLLADIVVASSETVFADKTHFTVGAVPGDGVHLVWPYLLGQRRAKYFLLTGQEIDAVSAQGIGIVDEVLPADELLPRAHELADGLAKRPLSMLRYTREVLNMYEREHLLTGLSHGLALEGVAFADGRVERAAAKAAKAAAANGGS